MKTFLALVCCLMFTVSAVALSSCSLMFNTMDSVTKQESGDSNGDPSRPNNSGGGSTYTIDVAEEDEFWYDNVVDNSLWRTTGTVGAYARDTLVLNGDGSYVLTKEMGADQTADDRWSADKGATDKCFNKYEYYGTYTKDGNTVTLSACTSVGVEVGVYAQTLGYSLGNFNISYTKTDDLTQKAGTCHDELVVDFILGLYIAKSDYGNCAQTVELSGDTFAFKGVVEGSGTQPTPPGPGTDEPSTPAKEGYLFTSATNAEITFEIYKDGTYTFAWAKNDVSESGTYTWDRLTRTLTITDPAGTETTATVEGDNISFTYNYSLSDQLNQAYTGSVKKMEAVICTVIYELIPVADAEVTLLLYKDGTYTYTDGALSETGAFDWDGETLTLTHGEEEFVSEREGNLLKLTYTSEGSSQEYVASVAKLGEAVGVQIKEVYSFTPKTNPAITFTLYSNGEYVFAWEANGVSERGTWQLDGTAFSVTDPKGTVTTATADGDTLSFTYNYSVTSQLNQAYTGSLAALYAAMEGKGALTSLYVLTGKTNELYTFTFFDYGVFKFFDGQHPVTEYGTWSLDGGLKIVDPLGKAQEITVTGDTFSFTYNYSVTSQLNQPYEGSFSKLYEGMDKNGALTPLYVLTGKTNELYTFTFFDHGVFKFFDGQHPVTEYGTWSLDGGLKITDPLGKAQEITTTGDTFSFTYYYSAMSMLNQPYEGSLSALTAAAKPDNGEGTAQ